MSVRLSEAPVSLPRRRCVAPRHGPDLTGSNDFPDFAEVSEKTPGKLQVGPALA